MFAIRLPNVRQPGFTTHLGPLKIAAQNSHTNLSAKNGPKLYGLHSQSAKAAKKRTSNKHMVQFTSLLQISGLNDLLVIGFLVGVLLEDALVGDQGEGEDAHLAVARYQYLRDCAHALFKVARNIS